MKKRVITGSLILIVLLISLTSAINLDISVKPISNTAIIDLDKPAVFNLTIRNLNETDSFEIYSLVGVDITPETPIKINSEQSKTITIEVMPQESNPNRGTYPFEYKIKNSENEIQIGTLNINILTLDTLFDVTTKNINPGSDKAVISIKNNAQIEIPNVKIQATSAFFDYEDTLSFKPLTIKEIEIPINKEKANTLNAGNYLVNTKILVEGKTVEQENIVRFLEQENIETTESTEGIIILRTEITKKNVGNVKKQVEITARKNLLSYIFTTVNINPTETKTQGFARVYTWKKELIPNEELNVVIKTNWWFPIMIIILIILAIYFIKRSVETDLILRKKVNFVKTRGGQFALKVTLIIKAKKFLEKITIFDKLPPLVKIYEKFGAIPPNRIDIPNKRIEYNIQALSKDEERIMTYIIYSKIGVVGRFELPEARVTYEREGKIKYATSNRSFFINEPKEI